MLPHNTRNLINQQENPTMVTPVEPTYVQHIYGEKLYEVIFLDDRTALLKNGTANTLIEATRKYLAKKFIVVEGSLSLAEKACQQRPHSLYNTQALAARAFLAAHAGSNYLRHPNSNPRSSMGIRK